MYIRFSYTGDYITCNYYIHAIILYIQLLCTSGGSKLQSEMCASTRYLWCTVVKPSAQPPAFSPPQSRGEEDSPLMSATSKTPVLDSKGQLLSPLIPGYRGRYLKNAALISSGFCIATLLVCVLVFVVRRGRRKLPPTVSFWKAVRAFHKGKNGSAEPLNTLWLQVGS